MKNEGWSYGDLAGELMERGIDIDDVDISPYLNFPTAEIAAQEIEREDE